jgi:hypothetical protein
VIVIDGSYKGLITYEAISREGVTLPEIYTTSVTLIAHGNDATRPPGRSSAVVTKLPAM